MVLIYPYFFVVDDPALKRKLLDENKGKLLADPGMDYPGIRKKLLDEDEGSTSPFESREPRSHF